MSQNFQAGDYLIFQIESGFGLLRILEIEERVGEKIWHLAAYNEMFLDVESADAVLENAEKLSINYPHLALTNRAFESTQTARMMNVPLRAEDLNELRNWQAKGGEVSDRSVRLLLGLR